MAVSTAQANAMLGGLPGTLYAQIHSGDPGANGTDFAVGGVSRSAVVMLAPANGQRAASGQVDVTGVPQGTSVSYVSYWSLVSGGVFEFSEPLAAPVTFVYAGRLRFVSQVFSVTTGSSAQTVQASSTLDASGQVDTSAITQIWRVSGADSSSQADAATARQVWVIATTDTGTSSADSNQASVGIFSATADTSSGSDANTVVQVFRSAVTDTSSGSDSNTATSTANAITTPSASATVASPVDFAGTTGTGEGVTAELWDGAQGSSFGKTTPGTGTLAVNFPATANDASLCLFTSFPGGTVVGGKVYFNTVGTGSVKMVIYTGAVGTANAKTRVGVSDAVTRTSTTLNDWVWFTFSTQPVLAAGDYWIGVVSDNGGGFTSPCDAEGSNEYGANSYASPTTPFTTTNTSTNRKTLYVEYV